MFVVLSLIVLAVAPVVVVIAALLRAPEAYENERGLQIIQKRSPQVERVAPAKKLTQGLHLTVRPRPTLMTQRSAMYRDMVKTLIREKPPSVKLKGQAV